LKLFTLPSFEKTLREINNTVAMILVVDIGNTNIVFGLYEGDDLSGILRLETDLSVSANDYADKLLAFLESEHVPVSKLKGTIIASVVPEVDAEIKEACRICFKREPVFVSHETDMGLKICYENSDQVGTDRLVNAVAAFEKYKQAVIIIDLGTATTFDYVTAEGEFLGGAISPGLKMSAEALFEKASKLPRVDLVSPDKVICADTVTNMQSGIVFGYVCLVDGLVSRMKKEMGASPYVVATGGLAPLILPHSDTIDAVYEYLTLYGLKIIFERNEC
jgi:type III pantothenate kinase